MASESSARENFLDENDFFMALALLTAKRSTVTDSQVGACIVNQDNEVIAVGYNQKHNGWEEFTRACGDKRKPEYKDFCECHAEINAIMNCADVKNCTMFVTEHPCNECTKLIVQAGIKSVVYLNVDKSAKQNKAIASEKMLKEAKISRESFYVTYQPQRDDICIEFKKDNTKPAKQTEEDIQKKKEKKSEKGKRQNSDISDSDYFMAVAVLTAMRSKDPNTQVGACIVKKDKDKDKDKVIAVGYNQMPKGKDEKFTWARGVEVEDKDNKHLYVCHAELSAIVSSADVKDCDIYVTLFPCQECAKLIIQAGIKSVVYLSDKYSEREETKAAKTVLRAEEVALKPFYAEGHPLKEDIVIKFE